MKPINLWVSDELYEELERRARKEGKIVNDYINYYLSENFNELYINKKGDGFVKINFKAKKNIK